MRYTDILWMLLRGALEEKAADLSDYRLDHDDWKEIISLARFNRVSALCSYSVSLLDESQRPPRSLWLPWVANQSIIAQKSIHSNQVAHELSTLLQQHGIETLVLKGPRLAACFPHPELREYDDLDFFHLGHESEADRVATEILGVAVNTDDPHHSTYTYKGVTIENHYTFFHNRHAPSNDDYEALLRQYVPSATFDALYLLRHTSSHFAASHATVKNICDWAMFVRTKGNDVDWGFVGHSVRQSGMEPFVAAMQQIAVERLGAAAAIPVANISKALQQRVENEMTYGEFGQPSHPQSGWRRAWWKWRRYCANRWKRRLVYRDAEIIMLLRGIVSHLKHPGKITHKH